MQADAQKKLERETQHCRAICTDDDAGIDDADAGSGDMNECIGHHAPHLPRCLGGLFTCLVDAGIFHRSASGSEIRGCVREANSCILDELQELRERNHHHGAAGAAAGGGGTSGSAGVAGSAGSAGAAGSAGSAGDPGNGQGDGRHRHGWHFELPRWPAPPAPPGHGGRP